MASGEDRRPLRKLVAEEIRRRRIAAGLSQEELAFRAGLHRTYISLVERCKKSPTIDSIEQIAIALGAAPAELLTRSGPADGEAGSDE